MTSFERDLDSIDCWLMSYDADDILIKTYNGFFGELPIDRLFGHPREALAYAEAVCRQWDVEETDGAVEVILRRTMNLRKKGLFPLSKVL